MKEHILKVYPSKTKFPQEEELAWKMASIAQSRHSLDDEVIDMIINRIIDNASVAMASINRPPILSARAQALSHPGKASLFGVKDVRVSPEWASWANGVAVRELDYHDTFLAAEYSHPGDNIPPILAVAQTCGKNGLDVAEGIATAYEIHVALVKSICLHKHKIDHIAHVGPASAAGIGTLLGLPIEIIYQSIQQALHVTCTTRQSRKGLISSWKAYAPAHATKLAVEAVDRSMRGETSPTPIYEGEDSIIAWMLDGPDAEYYVPLISPGEKKRGILDTYTKAHSAEYQSQALIDLAFSLRKKIPNLGTIEKIIIHTSHHTHYVIGTGANDPQKFDPQASRETLDHSIMYIFAVALEDGKWHHVDSYTSERAQRKSTIELWNKISTSEEKKWTKLYHDEKNKAFGGRVEVFMKDNTVISDELALADAHPQGKAPWKRDNYVNKFLTLSKNIVEPGEQDRFLSLVSRLTELSSEEVNFLNIIAKNLEKNPRQGIFEY